MIEKKIRLSDRDDKGNNIFLTITENERINLESIDILLEMKISLEQTENKGKNFLHLLFEKEKTEENFLMEISKKFRKLGLVNKKDFKSKSVLHYYFKKGSISKQMVGHLIRINGDINAVDNKGKTPLHSFFKTHHFKNFDFLNYLIEENAKIDFISNSGKNALHDSFENSNVSFELVKYLVGYPLNINQTDSKNRNVLFYAIKRENITLDILLYLLENNADPNIEDKLGNSALYYCYSKKKFEFFCSIICNSRIEKNILTFIYKTSLSKKDKEYSSLIKDYMNNGSVWTFERYKLFPIKFQQKVKNFLICQLLISKKNRFFKIPKPILNKILLLSSSHKMVY